MIADIPPPTISCAMYEAHAEGAAATLAKANAARLSGDLEAARCELEALLRSEPRNADAWVELGFVRSASGDAQGARAAFIQALEIAPDYDDARLGLAQLAHRSGDAEGARSWLRQIDSARRGDPEVATLAQAIAAPAARHRFWRTDASASYSTLSGGLDPWRETSLSIARRDGDAWFGAGVDYAERFGNSDVFGEVRFASSVRAGTWGLALGGAPEADFKPEAALRAEFATPEDADWTFDGSVTLARYAVGRIDRLGLRASHRLHERLRAIAQTVLVRDEFDELRTGYGVGAAWRGGERLEFFLNWSDAPESSEGATIDVRSLGFGVAADIAPGLRLRVGALQEERDAFDRLELSFALARTF
jgi:YaiO family outer membrane protein